MSALVGILAGSHALIAARTGHDHWLLTEEEAKEYGTAVAKALRHFSLPVTQKALDIGAAIFMAGSMTLPRLGAEWALRNEERKAKRPATVQQPNGSAGEQVAPSYPEGLGLAPLQ